MVSPGRGVQINYIFYWRFHREEMQAFDDSDIVNPANIGMRNLPRDAHFVAEARQRGLAGVGGLREELQRRRLGIGSSARYTSPMPPRPGNPRMR